MRTGTFCILLSSVLVVLMAVTVAVDVYGQTTRPGTRELMPLIVWNYADETLSWEVKFDKKKPTKFKIDFRRGTMTDGKDVRPLSMEERREMVRYLDLLLTEYTVASTEWFYKPLEPPLEPPATTPKVPPEQKVLIPGWDSALVLP